MQDAPSPNKSDTVDVSEYLAVLRRRKLHFLLPFILVLGVSVYAALALPPVYKGTATILIEREEIPRDLVDTTITGYVAERIQGLKQRLITHQNLWRVAEEIDYLGPERESMASDEVVSAMREGILVEMVDVNTTDPGTGRASVATIAFTVSFEAPTAEWAAAGANALANLYLLEDRRARIEQATEVTQFLGQQAEGLLVRIADLESKLADFKKENAGQMPGVADFNMRLLEQVNANILRMEERIQSLAERRIYLQSQLATTSPTGPLIGEQGQRVLNASERLAMLQAQYARGAALYADNHPDLVRLRREIELLQAELGDGGAVNSAYGELQRLRAELSALTDRYSDSHPDVRRLKRSIAEVQAKLEATAAAAAPPPVVMQVPTNPAYIRLQTELDALDANMQADRGQLEKLRLRAADLEMRLSRTPSVEQEYLALTRDYQGAVGKYNEIQDKILKASAAERLEEAEKAQRFALIGPAREPLLPERPNRIGIALLGMFLAMTSGLGAVAASEYVDSRVRGTRDLIDVFGAPPLAAIPYIENTRDVWSRRTRAMAGVTVTVAVLSATVALVHVYVRPLDEVFVPAATQREEAPATSAPSSESSTRKPQQHG